MAVSIQRGATIPPHLEVTIDSIPEEFRKHVDPKAPLPMRMMAAKGLVPMKPNDMLSTLAMLHKDTDKTIRDAAEASLKKVPKKILISALSTKIHPHVIDFFARNFMDQDQLSAAVIANPTAKDETITYLSYKLQNEMLLDRIAENQVRFLRFPAIIEALYFNPRVRMSTVSAIVDLAVREGIMIDHIPAFREAKESISRSAPGPATTSPPPSTPAQKSAMPIPDKPAAEGTAPGEINPEDMSLADFLAAMIDGESPPEETRASAATSDDDFVNVLMMAATTSDDKTMESLNQTGTTPHEAEVALRELFSPRTETERDASDIVQKLKEMPVGHKIRLAMLGDRVIRSILIRSTIRNISSAVLKNPGLTDQEVLSFAKSRSISEDSIREIANNRDWTRNYQIMTALATHPKTPMPVAMNFLKSMHPRDLKMLSNSRDISAVITREAKKLLALRMQRTQQPERK